MKFRSVFTMLTLTTLISSGVSPSIASSWQQQMLDSVNSLRAEKSLSPLKLCKPLTTAAQRYAIVMATQDFLEHTGKDGSTFGQRIQEAGYDWRNSKTGSSVAENIAAGQNSVREVMKGWRNSQGHYKNIIQPKFTHIGFGMSMNPKSTYKKYWVQNFGAGASC